MLVELRILSGSRAGQQASYDQPTITVGRHPSNNLVFDAGRDLDVSSNHAEFRQSNGAWSVVDRGSTNGTYVNGAQIAAETKLKSGDIVSFGPGGPKVELRIGAVRGGTEQRIAVAVKKQTSGLRKMLVASVLVVSALGLSGYWYAQSRANAQVAEMQRLLDELTAATTKAQAHAAQTQDTAIARYYERQLDSMRALVLSSKGRPPAQMAQVRQQIQQTVATQEWLPAVSTANDDAVAFLKVELEGKPYGGTAFSVSASGYLVTNRHNVQSPEGRRATSIDVQFANTGTHHQARVVAVSNDPDVDLAILKIDGGGPFPSVKGVSRDGTIETGASLATIGFPDSYDLPMEGHIVKTTLVPGTVSKRTSDVLQIAASWARHGASGSPVFNQQGLVVGVLYGGAPNSPILFAVPSDRVVRMLPGEAQGAVR